MIGSKNPIAELVVAPRIETGSLTVKKQAERAKRTMLRTIVQKIFSFFVNF